MNRSIMNTLAALAVLIFTVLPLSAAEVVTYYHNDHLGSPVVGTDSSGAVVWQQAYDPWGLKITTNTDARGYTGNWLDEETGLADHKARWYTSSIGRFTAIDPVKWHESNIHSFNRYSYSNNNPYRFDDRDGKMSREVPPVSPAYQSGPELGGGGSRGSGNVSGAAFAGAVIHSMSSLLPGNIYKPIGAASSTSRSHNILKKGTSASDGLGNLLNKSSFDRMLQTKGRGLQFQNSGSSTTAFKGLQQSFSIKSGQVMTKQNGTQVFKHKNRSFSLRSDSRSGNTISVKTDKNPQQIVIRFANP